MEDILIGTADRTILVFIPDPASTTGAGKTGLAAAAITVTYTRVETDNDVVHTDVTSSLSDLSALTDAHADWGWKEVSSTLSKGLYRLDIADAVFASGAWYAVVQVTITSGTAAATPKAFRLIARNDLTDIAQTGDAFARLGAPAGASIAADISTVDTVVDAIKAKTDNLPSDPADASDVAMATAAIYNRIGAPAGASIADDIAGISGGGLDAAGVRAAIGMASANLDDQLSDIQDGVDAIGSGTSLSDMFESPRAQPGQQAPVSNASILEKIDDIHKLAINKVTQDATSLKVYDAAGTTVDHKATVSDDGDVYIRGKFVSGP